MTTSPIPASAWTGRHDGDGPEHARWHEVIHRVGAGGDAPDPAAEHVALLGFRSDEGVRRNRGRVGAADGPAALRRALAPLALQQQQAPAMAAQPFSTRAAFAARPAGPPAPRRSAARAGAW